jgi:hypothetical protein
MKAEKKENHIITDPIEKNFLLHHVYLLGVSSVLHRERDFYQNIFINEAEVLDNIESLYKVEGVERKDFDFVSADFTIRGYMEMNRIRLEDESMLIFIKMTEKGMTAILTAEFLVLQDARQNDLQNIELTRRSIRAHEHQKFINWGLIIATALAAIMPLVAIWLFPPKISVTVPEQKLHQDIRIDSVWLHQQVDGLIQKRLSTLPLKEAKSKLPPKGVNE